MSDVWSERAEAYRTSVVHATGDDLDLVVDWCEPAEGVTVLDVATGGGHVARRLRERGATVVTVDPAPGMQADTTAAAEDLPFADASFDVVACRLAGHHFANVE
jgi:ubiquinone/menaquinone biosynthesis C-methylase UbiE